MKAILFCFLAAISFSEISFAGRPYPVGPEQALTPGSLCANSRTRRYPEKVMYCERNVGHADKWEVIELYNRKLGFSITQSNRMQFKIDHLIPLCAGGSNEMSNLWPQHESIYKQTDPLEGLLCEKMKMGRLLQSRAVELILIAKRDLSKVSEVFSILSRL